MGVGQFGRVDVGWIGDWVVWRLSRILERVSYWLLMSVTSVSSFTVTGSGALAGRFGRCRALPFPGGSLELGSERLRERGMTVERVVLLEREELDRVLFRMLGREDVDDIRLDLEERWLWLEIWRGIWLDSWEGVEVLWVDVDEEECVLVSGGSGRLSWLNFRAPNTWKEW